MSRTKTRSPALEFKSPKLRTFNHRIFEVSFTVPQIAMVPTDSSFKEKLPKYLTKGKGAFLADFSKEIHNGCTEIPLAMGRFKLPITLIDPAKILARALVKAVCPERLKE